MARDEERPQPTDPRDRGRVQRRARSPWRGISVGTIADATARAVGSPGFLIGLTVLIVVWIGFNWYGPTYLHWDTHELLLLNLMFSVLSSYSSPLILMAENRQLARDEVAASDDREHLRQQRRDMDFLATQVHSLAEQLPGHATRDDVDDIVREVLGEHRDELRALRRRRAPVAKADAQRGSGS